MLWDGAKEITALDIHSKTTNLPTDPASNTQVNTRLATSSYTAPDNTTIADTLTAINLRPTNPLLTTDSRLNNLDAAVSTRLASASYTAPDNVTIANTLTAINLRPTNPLLTTDTRLDNLDATISSRMVTFTYTAPDNASVAAIKTKTDLLTFTGANVNSNAQVVSDKTGYSLSVAPPTLSQIEASTILAKEATVAAIPINPLLANDARLNNLDASISSRLAAADYTAPPSVSGLATTTQLNSAVANIKGAGDKDLTQVNTEVSALPTLTAIEGSTVLAKASGFTGLATATNVTDAVTSLKGAGGYSNTDLYNHTPSVDLTGIATTAQVNAARDSIKGASDKDLTQVFNNTPSIDLSPITSKLPTGGAKIAGEGATAKNLDQITAAADPTLTAKVDAVKLQTDKMTFTTDNKIEARVSYSAADLQPPCAGDCF